MITRTTVLIAAAAVLAAGCSQNGDGDGQGDTARPEYSYAEPAAPAPASAGPILVAEPATAAGIDFRHTTGADGRKLMPETMGPGCALFDYDGDGWLDALFTDGRRWDHQGAGAPARLYRNDRGRFADITAAAGLDALAGYGMGVAAADYDADGDADLALTTVEGPRLLRNDDGVYRDVTADAGLALPAPEWSTSAAWLDADGDGGLDLFVANYVRWSPETDVFTTLDGTNKSYATPQVYAGLGNRLFRNLGDGTFADVSEAAGVAGGENKALGVVVLDIDDDGDVDIFVSNDTVANKLYVNDGRGVFTDTALTAGVGYDELGRARAGMGVDAGLSADGAPVIGIGNFSDEAVSLYEAAAGGEVFIDAAQRRGIATQTLPRLTFGTRFADLDQDGRDDLVLANGHIEPEIQAVQNAVTHAQPVDVFLAGADGRFQSQAAMTGESVGPPVVGRCLALGDLDRDGDLDGIVGVNGGAPLILRNATGGGRAVAVDLLDPASGNRPGLGARVELSAGDWSRAEVVRARGSYLGHSPYTVHVSVPAAAGDQVQVRVRWPDGTEESVGPLPVGAHYRIERGGAQTVIDEFRA
jgi:hypothetical protein